MKMFETALQLREKIPHFFEACMSHRRKSFPDQGETETHLHYRMRSARENLLLHPGFTARVECLSRAPHTRGDDEHEKTSAGTF